jgi:glycosyltransferase involved in cell wall biosynthesis
MKITAHTLVKNEARFLWYSVMSVINHVDRVLLYDTGSTDDTLKIIKALLNTKVGKEKIIFNNYIAEPFNEELARQKMLDNTNDGWLIVVDGDEIWWDESIRKVVNTIKTDGDKYESIVVPTINVAGDMFHYQEESAGLYQLAGRKGHYNLRGVNIKIPGLRSLGEHGVWGWADEENKMIQDRDQSKIKYIEAPYLHATFLRRAGNNFDDQNVYKRPQKLKHELGIPFPKDFYYPEVFFRDKPSIVKDVWGSMDTEFYLRSLIETPLRKVKRRILPAKVGY